MAYQDRWQILDELDEGGQGKVYRVLDDAKFKIDKDILPAMSKLLNAFASEKDAESIKKHFPSVRNLLSTIYSMENSANQGALKVLHKPEDARDSERAEERIMKEMKAMDDLDHPNLLRIIDYNPDEKWFVSQFHPKGSLSKKRNQFAGNVVGALKALRPIVEGVSEIHERGWVHRDIKPENVFIDLSNNLVLGDFGLIFFSDDRHTRLSGILENVGSRDWMPAWAMGMRIEDIKPAFDVFCLGKLLWAMISGKPILRLWYFEDDEFNLEKMFPKNPNLYMANSLLKKCVVEREKDCIPNAKEFLSEIDEILNVLDSKADLFEKNVERICRVCGRGKYILNIDSDSPSSTSKLRNFGLDPESGQHFKIFICNHCGHVQFFSFYGRGIPPAWPG